MVWWKSALGTSLIKEVGVVKRENKISIVKGGLMSYKVPILTPTNYTVWAVNVKAIMDAHDIWETVEPRASCVASNSKKLK